MSYDTNLRTAVAALIKSKGRYHTEQSYRALVEAFNAPKDLPSVLPMPAHDPIYDARCALQDKTDWSAS
jgi:hypothetical protein